MSTRLVLAESFAELWSSTLQPWLESLPLPAPESELVVLVPSHAAGAFLRERMAAAGLSVIGLKIWTPGQFRDHLLKRIFPDKRIALREDIGLLVTAAAEQVDPDDLHARAVAANPDDFLRALDSLYAAGWSGEQLAETPWRNLALQAQQWLHAADWWTLSEADWQLSLAEPTDGIAQMLVWGFSARHTTHWPLLLAALRHARNTLFCLPPFSSASAAQIWQSTLEERYGEAEFVGDVTQIPGRFASLADAFGMRQGSHGMAEVAPDFYQVAHPLAEGRLLAILAAEALATHPKARVGIILPPLAVAARALAAELDECALLHHDTFGHFPAPSQRQNLLNAWAAWQEEPRLRHWREFARLLTQLGREPVTFFTQTTRLLDEAAGLLLTDKLTLLFPWARLHVETDDDTHESLERWFLLPEHATLEVFLETADPALRFLGWSVEVEAQRIKYASLFNSLTVPISRLAFLRWLMGLLRTPGKIRATLGRNTLATIQVLNYADAEGLVFDVLLCGGLTASHWPVETSNNPFLSEALCNTLNHEALKNSRSGEGALILQDGKGLLLTRSMLYELSDEGMRMLVAETSTALTLSCPRHAAPGSDEELAPDDYLVKLFHASHGRLPRIDDFTEWQKQAALKLPGLQKQNAFLESPLPISYTKRAFEARRHLEAPFDEYSFCFRDQPEMPVALTSKEWESVVERPTEIWLKSILKVRAWSQDEYVLSDRKLLGKWLHEWLALERMGEFVPMPSASLWRERVQQNAQATRKRIEAFFNTFGQLPSLHWQAVFEEALHASSQLALTLGSLQEWEWVASRPKFDVFHKSKSGLPAFSALGTDFVFASRPADASVSAPWDALLLVEITSADTAFNKNHLLKKGAGLQLALTAWALEGGVARVVDVMVASPGSPLKPQAPAAFHEAAHLLGTLQRITRQGVFGQRGLLRDKFAFTPDYPLATLAVEQALLRKKWQLTFPEWIDS